MRLIIIGLILGSLLGLVAGTTASSYVSLAPVAAKTYQSQMTGTDNRRLDI